jgi:hypothetical protein
LVEKRREHMAPCIDGQRKEWLKCHILPCFLALLAELEASTVEFHHLELVLPGRDFCRSEFSEVGAEGYKLAVTCSFVGEDAGLEG